MTKRNKIIYWIATLWLALGMTSTGIVQIIQMDEEVERTVTHLGYPAYFLTILGVLKLMGVVVTLAPKLTLLKEWAYAGFFFAMLGAILSHVAMKDPIGEVFPAILLLVLIILSWYFRPENRRIVLSKA